MALNCSHAQRVRNLLCACFLVFFYQPQNLWYFISLFHSLLLFVQHFPSCRENGKSLGNRISETERIFHNFFASVRQQGIIKIRLLHFRDCKQVRLRSIDFLSWSIYSCSLSNPNNKVLKLCHGFFKNVLAFICMSFQLQTSVSRLSTIMLQACSR